MPSFTVSNEPAFYSTIKGPIDLMNRMAFLFGIKDYREFETYPLDLIESTSRHLAEMEARRQLRLFHTMSIAHFSAEMGSHPDAKKVVAEFRRGWLRVGFKQGLSKAQQLWKSLKEKQ